MWLAIFFILVGYVLTFIAFKSKGKWLSIIFIVVALGMSVVGAYYITQANPLQYPAITISSSSGNTIIPAYNVTAVPNRQSLSFAVILSEANIMIESVFVLLVVALLFTDYRKERRKKYE